METGVVQLAIMSQDLLALVVQLTLKMFVLKYVETGRTMENGSVMMATHKTEMVVVQHVQLRRDGIATMEIQLLEIFASRDLDPRLII
jgi:hypothetical protein